jgi:hypothetical protein
LKLQQVLPEVAMNDLFDELGRYRLHSGRASRIDMIFGWILIALGILALIGLASL